ncbi:apolipoprotein N-acyltransferase [Pyrinomonas methylaliphatogenes]|uniref:Apolipoprotein N-acyltransferase n=1 Tax=Pyrinomonas methylaliphatogenes TaxID=454194 RepID=A0A0B6WW89_9BACT|nr:apolipoprotein N-acyltransferase [Pyrinomonas methylaliphatogenes]
MRELKRTSQVALLRERPVRVPKPTEWASGLLSAALLVSSFPDFDLWFLAWVAFIPILITTARMKSAKRAFLLWWAIGALFFYGSCWWLTHAMIYYGDLPAWVAFPLLVPGALILGLFPAASGALLAWLCQKLGRRALLLFPLLWATFEWARFFVTGQLWNALGYSQAYVPFLIQSARWGGVYAVGFLIAMTNSALALALAERRRGAVSICIVALLSVLTAIILSARYRRDVAFSAPTTLFIAVQPNVPADFQRTLSETEILLRRHVQLSLEGLRATLGSATSSSSPSDAASLSSEDQTRRATSIDSSASRTTSPSSEDHTRRVVIWPESPMNFRYARDASFREFIAEFARANRVFMLFNAMEPAPANGVYNSAILLDESGQLVAQYNKIKLLPFGEYIPLPKWLPGVSLISAIVGDFTPGTRYTLMPIGDLRAGVFICFESAFPTIAREFVRRGADLLVNISNDGYLGETPVLHQHLANAIMRAVETGRPVLRVTNTGISAWISPRGEVLDATPSFQADVRIWPVERASEEMTFYAAHGDLFVALCALISLLSVARAADRLTLSRLPGRIKI